MKTTPSFFKPTIAVVFVLLTCYVSLGSPGDGGVQTDMPALKDVFAKDFYVGCILSYTHVDLSDDPPVKGQAGVLPRWGESSSHITCTR